MSIGTNIKSHRQRAGKTQQQIANETGLSVSYISQAERNIKINPLLATIHKLADCLDCEPSDLIRSRTG